MPKPPYLSEYLKLTGRLRDARLELDLDQSELARKLGVSQAYISNYERGQKTLNVVEFVAICAALGLNPGTEIGLFHMRRSFKLKRSTGS